MRDMTVAEIRAFLEHATRTAKFATMGRDGQPHVVPVWFVLDGDGVVLTTSSGSVKARNLRANSRVSLCVDDERPPFAFVTLSGTATLQHRPPDLLAWTTRIAGRYVGAAEAEKVGRQYAEFDDLIIRITVHRTIGRTEITA